MQKINSFFKRKLLHLKIVRICSDIAQKICDTEVI